MKKFGLGKMFQFNPELDAFLLFDKVEVWWRDGTWRHPSEWVFEYSKNYCHCHLLDIGWFGIAILAKGCERKYEF